MFNNPFREQAIAASANRQHLDRLLRVTAPHERIVLAAVGLILAGLAAWVLFGSIVRHVTLDGVLLAAGERHEVMTTEAGYFEEFLVEPGDRVEPGTAIARLTISALARETAVLRDRVARLESQVQQPAGDTGNAATELAAARAALMQMEAQRTVRELIVSRTGGEVMALRSTSGDYLPAGVAVAQLRDAEDHRFRVTASVTPRVAQRLRPGMRASVEIRLPDGATRRLEGTVRAETAGPSTTRLPELPAASAGSARRIELDLEAVSDPALRDGTPCRIRIVLGRTSLVSLLDLGSA